MLQTLPFVKVNHFIPFFINFYVDGYIYSGSSDNAIKPSNLRSSTTVKVPCAALFDRKCETVVSAERIKEKFSLVIGKWFKPIPSCKDVFYYSPTNAMVCYLWLTHIHT